MFKKILFFFAICSLFSFQNVFAYDDGTTHPALTDEIVDFYNLSFPDKQLTSQQKEWIVEGSILEDTPPRWINHFYDPIYKEGWNGEHAGIYDKEVVKLVSKEVVAPRGITPVSSLNWMHNEQLQSRYAFYKGSKTWERGLMEMVKGNEKEAYQILGYILHLIEDATVPDHTRNDTHAHELEGVTGDYGSPYEEYLKIYKRENLNIAVGFYQQGLRPIIKQNVDDYLVALSEYSNKYFFSKDTINDPKYQNPRIIRNDEKFGYGKDENNEEFLLARKEIIIQNGDKKTIYTIRDKSEEKIIESYFARLSRQAVLNGAGVINLFLEEAQIKKDYPQHLLTYDASSFNNFELPKISLTGEGARVKNFFTSFYSKTISTVKNTLTSASNFISNIVNKDSNNLLTSQVSNIIATVENETNDNGNVINVGNNATEPVNSQILENSKINNTTNVIAEIKNNEEIKQGQIKQIEQAQKIKQQIKSAEIIQNAEQQVNDFTDVISGGTNDIQDQFSAIVFRYSGGDASASGGVSGSGNIGSGGVNGSGSGGGGGSPQTYPNILITEIQLSPTANRFIELYNPNNSAVDLSDWYIHRKTQTGSIFSSLISKIYFQNKTIGAGEYFLISREVMAGADIILSSLTLTDSNVIQLKNPNGEVVDRVGWGEASDCEENCVANPIENQSISRKFQNNIFIDTNNNADDFEIQTCPSPKAQTNADCTQTNAEEEQQQEQEQDNNNSHLVISEIQVRGNAQDDEFVEIYNPADAAVSLNGYSIQYLSGTATSTENVLKKNFPASAQIAAKSFYLLVNTGATSTIKDRADMSHNSFKLSGDPTGATIFLVNATTSISNISDSAIIDSLSYGSPALAVSAATSTVPAVNESLERKALSNNVCVSAQNDDEFSGNSCDTDSDSDFEIRNSPNPQNSQNFSEPRVAPTIPQNFNATYASSTMTLSLNWNASQDYNGSTASTTYRITDISNSSSTLSTTETGATSTSYSIDEVGRDYTFSIQAFDAESLGSATTTAVISVPNEAPTAIFDFLPASPTTEQEITFNAASSTDSDGQIISYQWNFGDSATASTTQATTTHSYSVAGDYSVQLTVFDNNNASSTVISTISALEQNLPPFGLSNIQWGYINSTSTIELSFQYADYPFIRKISAEDFSGAEGYPWGVMVFYLNQDPPSGFHTSYYESASKLTVNYNHCAKNGGGYYNNSEIVFGENSEPVLFQCVSWSGGWRPNTYSPIPSHGQSGSITVRVIGSGFLSSDYFTIGFYNMDPWGNFYQVGRDENRYFFQN